MTKQQLEAQERRSFYYKSPKTCLCCYKIIEYEYRNKKFCNSSCSASYNNNKRGQFRTKDSKLSLSLKIKGKIYATKIVDIDERVLCEYGCGNIAEFTLRNGKKCHGSVLIELFNDKFNK